jgi:hypothetical protein
MGSKPEPPVSGSSGAAEALAVALAEAEALAVALAEAEALGLAYFLY